MKVLILLFLAIVALAAARGPPPFYSYDLPNVRHMDLKAKFNKRKVNDGKIVGGDDVAEKEIPWQTSYRQIAAVGLTHFCGGSVYDKKWVITAAHCCGAGSMVAGGIKLYADEGVEQRMQVNRTFIHPAYQGLDSDICLVELKDSLEFNDYVKPIGLPTPGGIEEQTGTVATVTGWGVTQEGGILLPRNLKKVNVHITDQDECNAAYSGDVTENMICGGEPQGGADSCQGDSGGPFFAENEAGEDVLVGIVSWGRGCAEAGYPGVYTRVSKFVDWIKKTVEANP